MTEERIREADRRLADAWLAARPVGPGSVVRARFGTLGAIDIVFTD